MNYRDIFAQFGATDAADALARGAEAHFDRYGVSKNKLRLAHWFAQFAHESCGFTKFEEDLRYSSRRLCAVWPRRFPTIAAAQPYAYNPEGLANKVYANRMGNSQEGDGWRFRGRGPQLTGRENYTKCAERTGLDLVNNPDLAADPENFVLIACDFWVNAHCNEAADDDNLVLVTKRVNGGSVGIQERRQLVEKGKRIIKL